MTIWKYPLRTVDDQVVAMPKGARILSLQLQGETPCIWALVDAQAEKTNRYIRIHGTDHHVEAACVAFVGTYQILGGALVFHVFDLGEDL